MAKVYPELKSGPVIIRCNNGGSGLKQKNIPYEGERSVFRHSSLAPCHTLPI